MPKGNSTTNAILVIILVLIVGFGVWYVMDQREARMETDDTNSVIEVNLGGEEEEGQAQ